MSIQSAYQAYQSGRFDAAERQIATYVTNRASDGTALQLGALIASARRDFQTAIERIRLSLDDPTNRHEKLNTYGNILRAIGDDVSAESAFIASIETKPDYVMALYNLARLMFETTRPHEAAEQFAAVVAINPDHTLAWRGYVNALLEGQRLDKAEEALKDAALPDAEKRYIRARFAFYRDDPERALSELSPCLADAQIGGAAFTLMLQILHMSGRWDEAGELMDRTLRKHPAHGGLWAAAIQSQYQSGDMDGAVSRLSQAPKDLTIRIVELDMLIKRQQFDAAEALARDLLQSDPGHHAVMQRLCHAALGTGHYDLAQQVADLGLQSQPNNQSYYAIKATAGRAKGQNYRYYFDYERFVRPFDLDPPKGWSNMADFNRDLKDALDTLHGFEAAPLDQTLRQGTQTAPNLTFIDHPAIRGFFEAIDPAIREYLDQIGYDPHHALLRRNSGGYHVRTAWSVRLGGGGFHVNHIHPEGWISSAYYVDVPEGEGKEGWIKFGEPSAPLNTALDQGPEYDLQPKAGRLVLFPSYLWHGTYPIKDGKTRMTLPIDILPARG
ncbi:MAG: tetratricopeptide repeat protein [Pseudomonadota bacterium]